ncbi:hypothetical protein GCM10022281_21560 [Sphingomonas rosea]|uniref:EfeO-type cupredoxin-like domain-containing protein n=1 Tax=Sphingomonas rosea TaxID=335605 RepID=A0ABP7UCA4_9SPHN
MRHILLLASLVLLPVAVTAAPAAETVVTLSNFNFAPSEIALHAGVPTVLRLTNSGGGGHSFAAPAFFAAARLDPSSAPLVHEGKVEIPGHSTVSIALTPTAGRYPLRCSHTLHGAFGMKGVITVS